MSASGMGGGVVAVVVTHRRREALGRLVASLAAAGDRLAGLVVCDHSPGTGSGVREVVAAGVRGFESLVIEDASNPGPGAGWANATRAALERFGEKLTAVWYLDDDVVIPPGGLGSLCIEAEAAGVSAIAPLLEDAGGRLWAFPEPRERTLRRVIRRAAAPSDALRLLGGGVIPFCWCTGACFLVNRAALGAAGFHRGDFFMLGEDLEYSMRVAARVPAGFTCRVSVPHLPPEPADPAVARTSGYVKFCSLLQNLSYLSFHSPDSTHMKFYLPGNFRRFFRTHGTGFRTAGHALACFLAGAVCGEPAGGARGARLRASIGSHGIR
jgi:GT2 family glycosyltransferase